ncbi:MAG: M48 family metalloprotease [Acidobacteria bacterium]|nr:M48 family metalloprotease [Acidobacteriota bacterium]
MNAPANTALRCPHGHGEVTVPDSRFCNTCGAPLVAVFQPLNQAAQPPMPPMVAAQFSNQQIRPAQSVFANPAPAHNYPQNGYAQPPFNPQMPGQQFNPQMQGQQFNPQMQGQAVNATAKSFCKVCSGNGATLDASVIVCPQCRWLRPLAVNYKIDCEAFLWAQDGAAMSKLRSMSALNSVAKSISDKVGRRWIETTFNAIRLSDRQLPDVYAQAVRAARLLGMSYMPDVYVSGDRMWDALIFGSDTNAFLVLGTALITNFRGDDLLFILAREMGHCRAGHALWKTVIRFLVGEMAPHRGIMAGGLVSAVGKVLNPGQLIESAMELPLLAWARQAEITADRAGLLAVGDEAIARRVLLAWSLKSSMLCQQINIEEWLQQEADDDNMTQLSEMLSSTTPYITRRLRLIQQFAAEPQMQYWGGLVKAFAPKTALPKAVNHNPNVPQKPAAMQTAVHHSTATPTPKPLADAIKINCSNCQTAMRIPKSALAGKAALNVKCPNGVCGKVITLKKQAAPAAKVSEPQRAEQLKNEANLSADE